MENEVKTMKFAALNVDREDIKRRDIQALIFDFDGLLVDTETCLFRAWEALMKPFGIDVSPLQVAGLVGSSVPATSLCDLYRYHSKQVLSDDEIRQQVFSHAYRLIALQTERKGVRCYLDTAKQMELKMALATSSEYEHYMPILKRLNLKHYFDCFTGAEEISIERRKPSPDVYLTSLEKLGVSASQAIAFEDSPPGVTAARAAGISTVAVTNYLTQHLDVSHADIVLSSMSQISLAQLIINLSR
ncbi:HAD family hydrolase [Vibrio diabolicus]|uniref:HAD family hydrolase n=1 Tax=Vibrio diabolicus TaxID=50719 RepID=UPI00211A6D19|nr:HAD family phosphatase [Vibrio diabolicus]MCQ9049119.1 HAD family phosphatase [Vibrio diabolicus]